MSNKKGLWIALGGCGVLLFAGAIFVGAIVFTVVRHLEIRPVSTASAGQEYDRLRNRFAGQIPLMEIDRDNPARIRLNRPPEQGTPGKISTLHIFAWNPREGKLVNLDLPIWLLRFHRRPNYVHWNWGGEGFAFENVDLSVEDIERHGPGLILDFEDRHGERVLLWTE
jgi:hypothetical protein